MRTVLAATVSAIGLGIVAAGNASALPISGSAVHDSVDAAAAVSKAYYYRYHYYYVPRHRYYRYYYRYY